MINKPEKSLIGYSTLFIALVLNAVKLLAINPDGVVSQYSPFYWGEYIFQLLFNALFVLVLFGFNLNPYINQKGRKVLVWQIIVNLILLAVFVRVGTVIQRYFFEVEIADKLFRGLYALRLFISLISTHIVVRVILHQREMKRKDQEAKRLKDLYQKAQMQALKQQLNPHFFFNSLSSLSAIVQENPAKAQHYISDLSKVFRYVLKFNDQLVTLQEELQVLQSYTELIKMRFEEGFVVEIDIDQKYLQCKLPHMTLQPLLENAIKHNVISISKPLHVEVFVEDYHLVVKNNLQLVLNPENSSGTGLSNLSERYRNLLGGDIYIERLESSFSIIIPLNMDAK